MEHSQVPEGEESKEISKVRRAEMEIARVYVAYDIARIDWKI